MKASLETVIRAFAIEAEMDNQKRVSDIKVKKYLRRKIN